MAIKVRFPNLLLLPFKSVWKPDHGHIHTSKLKYKDNFGRTSVQVKCLKGNEKRPVFKYAGKQQEKVATWTMMDWFPFISIYSFPFIHEVKKCAKYASTWTDFSSCPNISQCSTPPQRLRSYFCSCGWMMDGSPFYHHIQADIHYSWGHIKSPSHFPVWTNESQAHNLPPKRKT